MEQENNQDNFSFDEFLTSDDSKKEFGITEPVAEVPATPVETKEVVEDSSPSEPVAPVITETTEQAPQEVSSDTHVSQETQPEGMPVRAVDEPDWKYDYRVEIWEKQQALKNATSDSERKEIKSEMTSIRKDMANRSRMETDEYEDIPQQDIAQIVQQELYKREQIQAIDKAEADFLKRHPEIKNPMVYNNFIEFVGENFNLQGKSYKGITAILEMAHETLFPKNVEKKIAESKKVEQKMNAVDFSGSTASDDVPDEKVEQKKLVEDIKKTSGNDFGWTID